MKKLLIAVVLLAWSEIVLAIDGNALHELFNTPAPYNDAASAYVAGIVDYDKTAYLIEVGSVGNGKFRMAHICWPQASDAFVYGPDHTRVQQIAVSAAGTVTTVYVSSSFQVVKNSSTGTTEYHNYVNSPTRSVAMLTDSTAGTTGWRYFLQDQLGSVEAVADQTGAVVERLSYDAFGRRRNVNGTDSTSFIAALDTYGYTNQEEMDNIGLVNMNGRIYDPTVARFMSADPTISNLFDLQSHNRYSYVQNRALNQTDPTGFKLAVPEGLGAELVVMGSSFFDSDVSLPGEMQSYIAPPTPIFDGSGNIIAMSNGNGVTPVQNASQATALGSPAASSNTGSGAQPASTDSAINGIDNNTSGTSQASGDTSGTLLQPGSAPAPETQGGTPPACSGAINCLIAQVIADGQPALDKFGDVISVPDESFQPTVITGPLHPMLNPDGMGDAIADFYSWTFQGATLPMGGGIGWTGKTGEFALKKLVGGTPQKFFRTTQGARFIDQLADGIANEAKVGYTSASTTVRLQVSKDLELLDLGDIEGSVWHFYKSSVTGLIGPSGPLRSLLEDSGITVILHDP